MILPLIWAYSVYKIYLQETEESGIFGITYKSRFVPVYKSLPFPELNWKGVTNIQYAIGRVGVYQIKENGVLVYVGASKEQTR